MSGISTHILDLTRGAPVSGVLVRLEREEGGVWQELFRSMADAEGRVRSLVPPGAILQRGRFRLGFETGAYFRPQGISCFYPHIEITFDVEDPSQHYHVPLLLTPHSYSTYRGS